MDNKISTNKIIADIKATKGNRSGCQGLSSSLESDGYITSICKWVRATSPDRINALVEHVEKQDAALIAWGKNHDGSLRRGWPGVGSQRNSLVAGSTGYGNSGA